MITNSPENSTLDVYLPPAVSSTLRRDVISAYIAAATRIGAWVVVMGIVRRSAGDEHLAILLLIRGTIGILNYASAGLSPALIHFLPRDERPGAAMNRRAVYSNGLIIAGGSIVAGLMIAGGYALVFDRHLGNVSASVMREAPWAVVLIGFATLARLASDAPAAALQTNRRIALDNGLLSAADAFWAILVVVLFRFAGLFTASATYALANVLLMIARTVCAARAEPAMWPPRWEFVSRDVMRRLLAFGGLVLLAQLAEYFYAPTDYILIAHFFGPAELAAYGPGVQIDLGLLMLVTALAGVLLPHSAIAHAAQEREKLRRYYAVGTLASIGVLLAAASAVWVLAPILLRLWFGQRPPNTLAILPLVLVGTVVGGSSAVGRSILLGMGKVKPFTAAAILAGMVNVMASYCFVRFGKCGLPGILYGTLVAVVGRCGIWMPWYVLKTLNGDNKEARAHEATGPLKCHE